MACAPGLGIGIGQARNVSHRAVGGAQSTWLKGEMEKDQGHAGAKNEQSFSLQQLLCTARDTSTSLLGVGGAVGSNQE